ncbi:hypothetical protein PR048_016702 [Dryococelus australis]|uniref:Uncharacterized protein n=1 Tax=Dryococelus australis TaxID=614101 RepID=A0ABQ9H7M8_9NEOP|nr:hypothetical protein PR048_016702 [Dryococelus australis]
MVNNRVDEKSVFQLGADIEQLTTPEGRLRCVVASKMCVDANSRRLTCRRRVYTEAYARVTRNFARSTAEPCNKRQMWLPEGHWAGKCCELSESAALIIRTDCALPFVEMNGYAIPSIFPPGAFTRSESPNSSEQDIQPTKIREFNDLQARHYRLVYKYVDTNCTLVICCHSGRRQLDIVLQEASNTVRTNESSKSKGRATLRRSSNSKNGWLKYRMSSAFISAKSMAKAIGNRAGRCRWLVGFLGDLPFVPPLHSDTAPYSSLFTLVVSQDLDVKSRPNLFTHSFKCPYTSDNETPIDNGTRSLGIGVIPGSTGCIVAPVGFLITPVGVANRASPATDMPLAPQ